MAELVIVTKNPDLEIGKVYRGLTTGPHNEPEPNQCYRVVAHSTEEAWVNCLVAHGKERAWQEMICRINEPWYYYQIETD
ncbi:MAG: hypothetical protein UT65_C0010G0012 [Parcubacteria group bacterium GW2011_GWF2_39_8b]|nr:MAG: hypothetical protein UT65_C0010G0012 [Parcubacteria group bacterium GW2011_GWF2_39_8b]